MDIFPYREDGIKAAFECFEWIKGLKKLIEKVGKDKIQEVIAKGDATESVRMVREAVLGL